MRLLASFALVAVFGSTVALAQSVTGYWFVAPGGATASGQTNFWLDMGGGAEFAIKKGIAAGIEAGAIGPTKDYTGNVLGTASANGYYHVRLRDPRLDPFVTAGYSLFYRRGTANLLNFGGGLNYWFARTVAVRFEFRDHVDWASPATVHYWGFRMGLSFTAWEP